MHRRSANPNANTSPTLNPNSNASPNPNPSPNPNRVPRDVRRMVLSLQPTVTPAEATEAAEEDWVQDSEGKAGLNRERIYVC